MTTARKEGLFDRSRLLLGSDGWKRLGDVRVLLFGVGGVGSWVAEALVRTGISRLTIVDRDVVAPSNVNRQAEATAHNIGKVKVEAMRDHLLAINPDCDITALATTYDEQTAPHFPLDDYDYVVDAIDSLSDKALLLLNASRSRAKLFSAMGAALKLDPQRIRTAEFWNVRGCPLARAIRKKYKHDGVRPARKFTCVYSEEVRRDGIERDGDSRTNGSLVHITAIYGFTIAGLIIKDIAERQATPTCQN